MLRQAQQINSGAQTLGSLWSPPPWMKANGTFNDAGARGTLLPDDQQPLADYFAKFLQAYAAQGVTIDAIAPQNEPQSQSPFPGMNVPEATEGRWITQNLEPTLAAADLHTQIYGLDDGAYGLGNPTGVAAGTANAQALLQSSAGPQLIGIAWHCYGGMGTMSQLHQQYPQLKQIVSECSPGIIPYSASELAIDATRNWASEVALWNLALDPTGGPVQTPNDGCGGCTGVVTVDEQTHSVAYGQNYYEMGQVSRYVQPGAVRIASTRPVSDFVNSTGYGVTLGVDDTAFRNPDGSKVLVAYNNSTVTETIALMWHGSICLTGCQLRRP